MRRHCLLRLCALLLVAFGAPALAGDHELNRATLKGLSGVCVFVIDLEPTAQAAGFDSELLRTDVELRLRMAGVRVLNDRDLLDTPAAPCLYVTLNPLHSRADESQAFGIVLELSQLVRLQRDSGAPLAIASTWSITATRVGQLADVRATVRDMTDIFVDAWQSVNPQP